MRCCETLQACDREQETNKKAWPEVDDLCFLHRLYRQWTYSYMRSVFAHDKLTQSDLYQAPESLQSQVLREKFWKYYHTTNNDLLYTLWSLAKPTFLPAGLCQFVSILSQVAVPLLVRQLLILIEAHPNSQTLQALPYAIAIFIALLVYGVTNHRQRHLAAQTGICVRAAILNVVYEQIVLRLTPAGRMGLTTGQVSTLIAVDSQKLYEVTQEAHLIWALPLAIVLVTISLVVVMGPVTLVGIAVLIANVPLVQKITASMLAIRSKRVKWTDRRIETTNSVLQGIKVTKLNNYEQHYETILAQAREQELYYLEREAAVWATTLSVSKLSSAFAAAATFTVYVLIDEDNILTAAQSFSVFLLFAALRFPINYAGRLIGKLAQAKSSLERIAAFLERNARVLDCDCRGDEERKPKEIESSSTLPRLMVKNGSFGVGTSVHGTVVGGSSSSSEVDENGDGCAFTVSGFDFTVSKGEVLAVCGPVGCGKSTLINGLVDEVPKAAETVVSTNGSVALVPQTPFILNDTLRENILFGRPYDANTYNRVVEACCLWQDIENLGPTKDLTEIGERGVTLSGGQKQRLSLARAVYGRPDVVLLDDPLSALDASTAKLVFKNLIKGPGAFLSDSAVVLVTHASHFLNRVDRVLVIVDGQGKFMGSWTNLLSFQPDDTKTKIAVDHIRASVQEEHPTEEEEQSLRLEHAADVNTQKQTLMTREEREHGLSSLYTWLLWFKHAGGFYFASILVFFLAFDRIMYFGQEYWVARWTDGASSSITAFGIYFPPQTEGRSAQYKYLAAYAVIIVIALVANFGRSEWSVTGGSRAARSVYSAMLKRVLRAPMSYFETTPMGRLLNRFTYDVEIVDFVLTQNMSLFLIAIASYISGAAVMIGILPYVAAAVVPITILYCFLLWFYRKSGIDLQRLDAMSRSPIQAMVTEGMDGFTTIRVLQTEQTFLRKFRAAVDTNSSAMLNYVSAQRWLGCRIELMGAIIVFVPTLLVVCLNNVLQLGSGLIGLLVVGSMNFTLALSFLVDFFGDAEASITAIERVDAMAQVPQEAALETDDKLGLPEGWPRCGLLEFDNVCMRYRPELPLALNGLSFRIPAGKMCGVAGKTGAGKSSLTVSLFRLVEIESGGRILLDGVDLKTIGLSDVRGRKHGMSIIPQDPFLSGRTIRECLDPFGLSNDKEMEDAISAVHLENLALNSEIQEGGSNLSVGERQLLNLARALLSKPKVLVLDEATASIDGATDALIQAMLRTKFPDTTLLTIAHRLNTIMDYDLILVMDSGRAAEFGPPSVLLENEQGLFSELVDATGPESSKSLREIAKRGRRTTSIEK